MATDTATPPLELDATPPEVKRYQRQKLQASIVSTVLSFVWLALLGFVFGPALGEQYTRLVRR